MTVSAAASLRYFVTAAELASSLLIAGNQAPAPGPTGGDLLAFPSFLGDGCGTKMQSCIGFILYRRLKGLRKMSAAAI